VLLLLLQMETNQVVVPAVVVVAYMAST